MFLKQLESLMRAEDAIRTDSLLMVYESREGKRIGILNQEGSVRKEKLKNLGAS